MKTKTQVLIVDDHPVVWEGLALRINRQPDLAVCGEARSPAAALKLIATAKPDIAVIDLMLRDGGGLDLIRDIATRHPGLPTLVFSGYDERLYAPRALRAGARGYVMKQEATEKVVEAIRYVLDGHICVSKRMQSRFLDGLAKGKTPPGDSPLEHFTDRELEVYRLLGAGLQTRNIAAKLHLSISTIETYCERIKLRLSLESRSDLVRHAAIWANTQESC